LTTRYLFPYRPPLVLADNVGPAKLALIGPRPAIGVTRAWTHKYGYLALISCLYAQSGFSGIKKPTLWDILQMPLNGTNTQNERPCKAN
jgi:hypothetical protein